MSPSDRVAQLYPQTPGSHFIALYDSQGYGGGILTDLHTGVMNEILRIFRFKKGSNRRLENITKA
jgi:hypothetical protein